MTTMMIPKPRTKEKDVRTEEILKAAMEVFFERGYQNTTVDAVAKKAGIAKGTVYLYYKGKEDLYASLMIPALEYLGNYMQDFLEDLESGAFQDGVAFMDAFCDVMIKGHALHREGLQIFRAFQIANLFNELSEDTAAIVTAQIKKNYMCIRKILAVASERGLIGKANEIIAADVLVGLFLGLVQMEENKMRWTNRDHLASTVKYAFRMLYKGLCKNQE